MARSRSVAGAAVVTALFGALLAPALSVPSPAAAAGLHLDHAGASPASTAPVAAAAGDSGGGGYWLAATDGAVFAFGDAPDEGSAAGDALRAPVVGMAPTPDDRGYWLAGADGGVFAFGDAGFAGSMGGRHLVRPVVAMAADDATGGYWLVAADGGVFAFGAPWFGSTGGVHLDAPVVGMAPTPDDRGYWLVAADGGVFAFGDAGFAGSMGGRPLVRPVVTMAADDATGGYWLVAADGGVFGFGAPWFGSTGGDVLGRAVVGAVPGAADGGYRLVGADGAVYAFGDATDLGSVTVAPLAGLTVVLDPGHDGGNGADPGFIDRPIDGGGFTESCDTVGTTTPGGYPEHAFTWAVALDARAALQALGATVALTRQSDTGVGPCVNQRAEVADVLGAAAAVSIHADGGPPGGTGFAIDEPAPVVSSISDNRAIVGPSAELGAALRAAFAAATGEPPSDYTGTAGIVVRRDLGGLDLSTVPKVLIECANMRNTHDAALTQSAAWQGLAGRGIAGGVAAYLEAALRT